MAASCHEWRAVFFVFEAELACHSTPVFSEKANANLNRVVEMKKLQQPLYKTLSARFHYV